MLKRIFYITIISLTFFGTSCQTEERVPIYCNVQYTYHEQNESEDQGKKSLKEAIRLYRTFPFDKEVAEFDKYDEMMTVPTITFITKDKHEILATWALDSTQHEIYLKNHTSEMFIRLLRNENKFINCIKLFYNGRMEELHEYMTEINQYETLIEQELRNN